MGQQKDYEEYTIISPLWSWVILIAFSAVIMGWGMFIHTMGEKEPVRQWDFGTLPDVPAESVYSTASPPSDVNVPLQIERLPEAQYDRNARSK